MLQRLGLRSSVACLAALLIASGCGSSGGSTSGTGGAAGQAQSTGGATGAGGRVGGTGGTPAGTGGTPATGGTGGLAGARGGTGGIAGASGGAAGSAGGRGGAGGGVGGNRGGPGGGRGGSAGGAAGGPGSGGSAGGGGAGDAVNATALAVAMGFGANIGNTFENTTAWETGWGQPLVTQAFINGMASRGIKSVRVPVAWNTYATNGVIDATKTNRVKQVVGWILDAGMYPMVNIHWDGGWIDSEGTSAQYTLTSDVKTKFASYWTQIATAFASVGNNLIFEGLNEEGRFYVNGNSSGTPDYAALNTLNQLFVTTVRNQSGYNKTRPLLFAGFNTDPDLSCANELAVPSDPAGPNRLLLSIHYYRPWTFCGLDTIETWGSPQTTWGSATEKTQLDTDFTKMAACSSSKKVPIIIGEFGVTKGMAYPRQSASRILWMETVAKAALAHGMVPMLWDTATDISRTDGSFDTELQTVMRDLGN